MVPSYPTPTALQLEQQARFEVEAFNEGVKRYREAISGSESWAGTVGDTVKVRRTQIRPDRADGWPEVARGDRPGAVGSDRPGPGDCPSPTSRIRGVRSAQAAGIRAQRREGRHYDGDWERAVSAVILGGGWAGSSSRSLPSSSFSSGSGSV
jgi:hypothetical protein